ncbi:hypothetical protein [Streptococcus suis]|uniref:hypothetical protein n=1 Tax=Streptococcus suis TaxID=1307 RepID=UPI00163A9D4B|nr:hypothetical protein [Streptococcus suis]
MNTKTMEQFEHLEIQELSTINGGMDPFTAANLLFLAGKAAYWIGEKAGEAYYYHKHP